MRPFNINYYYLGKGRDIVKVVLQLNYKLKQKEHQVVKVKKYRMDKMGPYNKWKKTYIKSHLYTVASKTQQEWYVEKHFLHTKTFIPLVPLHQGK